MHCSIRAGFMLTALSAAASAQSMLEHAMVTGPAAAGATTGAVAGAKLGQLLNQAGAQGEPAAKSGKPKTVEIKPEPAPLTARTQAAPAPPSSHFAADGPVAASGFSRDGRPAPQSASAGTATLAMDGRTTLAAQQSASLHSLTREQLLDGAASIQPGAMRAEVLEKLGAPSYKIAYDDGGALMERYKFRVDGKDIVVVELKDGVVDTARPLVH